MPGWHRVDQVQLLTCWAAWLHFAPLPTSLPPFFLSSIPPFSIWPCSQGYTTKKEARYSQCLRSCKTFVDNYKISWFWQIGDITPLLCWLPDCSWGVSQGAHTDDWCRSLFPTWQGSWRGQNPVLIRVNKGKHWGFKTNKQTNKKAKK